MNITAEYILNIATSHFWSCTLLLVYNTFLYSNSGESQVEILTRESRLLKYLLNFQFAPNTSKQDIVPWSSSSLHVKENAASRFTKQCTLTVILSEELSPRQRSSLGQIITPTFLPIVKKDTDYFVFIARPDFHDVLLKEPFPSSLKFKIAVGESQGNLMSHSYNQFSRRLVQLEKNLQPFPDFFWNLLGYTLRVSVPYARALVESSGTRHLDNGKRGRWMYLFNDYLTLKFNCTYNMFPSTGKYGQPWGGSGLQLPDGTWIGVIGDLYEDRADLGICVANTDKRTQVVGFTDSFFDTGCLSFVTGNPAELFSVMTLFWPFNLLLWLTLIGSTILVTFIFFTLGKLVNRLNLEFTFLNSPSPQMFAILSPFVEQDVSHLPHSSTLRIFLSLWSLFAIVVTNLYRSKLVTLLAFPVLSQVPQTFQQLAFSGLDVGFMKNGDSAYNTLAASTDPVYVELIRKMTIIKGVNLTCLQNVIRNKGHACVAYDFDVVYLLQRNLSDLASRKLSVSQATTYNIWMGLATQSHSRFQPNFDKILRQTQPFHLSRIWDKMDMYENVRKPKLKWWKDTNQTDKVSREHSFEEGEGSNLTFSNIKGVFYIFGYSILICAGAFLYEQYSWISTKCLAGHS